MTFKDIKKLMEGKEVKVDGGSIIIDFDAKLFLAIDKYNCGLNLHKTLEEAIEEVRNFA